MSEDTTGMSPAELRAMADKLECEADACAITYQDRERRREATAWHRQRVRQLRADASRIELELAAQCAFNGHQWRPVLPQPPGEKVRARCDRCGRMAFDQPAIEAQTGGERG